MITRRALVTGMLAGAAGSTDASAGTLADGSAAPASDAKQIERAIWRTYYDDTRVWGYVDRHSVEPGQKFNLMLSTGPDLKAAKGKIEIYRMGYYGAQDRALIWRSPTIEVSHQPVEITAASVGAGWTASIEQIATGGWRSGYYAIDFVDDLVAASDTNVAFIVVTDTSKSGDVLVVLSTNTWQAYNEWGGYSFYASDFIGNNAQALSFDRPTAPEFFDWEYYLVLWLEQVAAELGIQLSYTTNFDIYRDSAAIHVGIANLPVRCIGAHEHCIAAIFKDPAMHRLEFFKRPIFVVRSRDRTHVFLNSCAIAINVEVCRIRYLDTELGRNLIEPEN